MLKTQNLKFLGAPLGVRTNRPRLRWPWGKNQNSGRDDLLLLLSSFQKGMSHCSRIKTLGGDSFSRKRAPKGLGEPMGAPGGWVICQKITCKELHKTWKFEQNWFRHSIVIQESLGDGRRTTDRRTFLIPIGTCEGKIDLSKFLPFTHYVRSLRSLTSFVRINIFSKM